MLWLRPAEKRYATPKKFQETPKTNGQTNAIDYIILNANAKQTPTPSPTPAIIPTLLMRFCKFLCPAFKCK
ncbi:hypothetical protein L596_017102 [Steinernema carpocapsae]|uniref:Uncharacterized protein n=1 Tax=Steinernema carpocapsae TaxID=34508 RepID=A0A4U5N0V7_STECR|nr:hypothetical protein L596_017102 [Steinernema carpocapsae]